MVATLHRLGKEWPERIEAELFHYARERPTALVLTPLQGGLEGSADNKQRRRTS
jgi:hypothetical protein